MQIPDKKIISANVTIALAEDVGSGDLTAALVDADTTATASIVVREQAVLAGQPWVNETFYQLDESVELEWLAADGEELAAGDCICRLNGPARSLLTGERTALNFLQTLSATATTTARYVAAIAHTGARILDTRKTLPGLRAAQKYAVLCGGGTNHRQGLFDAILIKENHINAAGGITTAVSAARKVNSDVLLEVEVENLTQLAQALDAGVQRILLDNFDLDELASAVAANRAYGNAAAELEASGGLTLDTLRAVAETGVDFISTGAITKHVRAIDLTMRFG